MSELEPSNSKCVTPQNDGIICYAQSEPTPPAISNANSPKGSSWRGKVLRRDLPQAPIIGSTLLQGGAFSFLAFLLNEDCKPYLEALFRASGTSVATMVEDLRKAIDYHHFGHRQCKPGCPPPKNPGKLDATKAESKKALKDYVRRAYRGDPERRGILFWQRVAAGQLWRAYEDLLGQRVRAERTLQQEIAHIERLAQKPSSRAGYMRQYRAGKRASKSEQVIGAESEAEAITNPATSASA